MNRVDCPVCKGTGKFSLPKKIEIDSVPIKEEIVLGLRKNGYSMRQIQVAMGYKSPRSIQYIIDKYNSQLALQDKLKK
jgi:C4-type Zn-finger protein